MSIYNARRDGGDRKGEAPSTSIVMLPDFYNSKKKTNKKGK